MSQDTIARPENDDADDAPNKVGLIVSCVIVAAFAASWLLIGDDPASSWTIAFLLLQVAVISVVIWQACDPFADAAQWVGDAFRLPGSVRGATLDAVASSMPELFSGIFFVVLALSAADSGGDEIANLKSKVDAGAEGFGSTIATCAGSAVYNMVLIPAFCALVISFKRTHRPMIEVEDEVISRDGIWFVACELMLIVFLYEETMSWWMGLVFIGTYVLYIFQLYRDARRYRHNKTLIRTKLIALGVDSHDDTIVDALKQENVRVSMADVDKVKREVAGEESEEDEEVDSAGLLFGYLSVPLNKATAAIVIVVSTLIAAGACYFLVEATRETATTLGVPAFFVAVILAAAASSVPDTFLAIGAAKRGDDSGAVSNAFGSNIFDICICISIPLLINSYLTGWQPVSLLQDGKAIPGLTGLRILLVVLTVITLAIMWHNRQLTRNKALVLCALYGVFIGYAVLGSLNILF